MPKKRSLRYIPVKALQRGPKENRERFEHRKNNQKFTRSQNSNKNPLSELRVEI